ncbi:MAG: cell division protein FtsA [Candidatus Saccharibacteria bacterium]|nr:cell division protein FtsA [Candidatus Saccharibacteria bacterium]
MEEQSKYAFGIDVGTETVRAVALEIKGEDSVSVIGYGEAKNERGMHKGIVTNLAGPAEATDKALKSVESMSGVNVDSAYVSINGAHIASEKVSGMIAVSSTTPISNSDLDRLEDTAMSGRITTNREVLDVVPLNYILDGQGGIRSPLGMTANKIEIVANVVSGLRPSVDALGRAMSSANLHVLRFLPTSMAAARAVLSEKQMENGVAVIDLGASTTSVAIYEEGDLQYIGVINAGANNITKDLAISLEINTDAAEEIKLKHVTAEFMPTAKEVTMKAGGESVTFSKAEVNEIVKDRLVDIFEHVSEHLARAGYAGKLPEGAVIVGAGAKMKGLAGFAKETLKMATRIGVPGMGLTGVIEDIEKPEYATALGLALSMADDGKTSEFEEKEKKAFSLFGFLKKKKKA